MKISKLNLRQLFAKGLKPSQEAFYNFFDSYWHKDELLTIDSVKDLSNQLSNKLDVNAQDSLKRVFDNALKQASFGIKGKAIPTTVPTVYNPATHPDGLYEKYDVEVEGTYVNFLKADGQPLVITADDLKGLVQITVVNGTAEISVKTLPQGSQNIRIWTPANYTENEQVIKNNITYIVPAGKNATPEDTPGISKNFLPIQSKKYDKIIWFDDFFLVGTGQESPADFMKTSDFFEVGENKTFTLSRTHNINYRSIYFYDDNFDFISKTNTDFFTTPEGCRFLRISRENGETIDLRELSKTDIVVSQEYDDYDFKSLQKATFYAELQAKPVNVWIKGKIILEDTWVVSKFNNYIGDGSETSHIFFLSNKELLQTSLSCFKNLKLERDAILEWYTVHPDYAGEGLIEFDNCEIINTMGSAIGAGSHSNQTLRVKNSILKSVSEGKNPRHLSPVVYFHNNVADVIGIQRLELINVTIYSDYERPLQITDQNLNLGDGLNRTCSILAIGCRFFGAIYGLENMLIAQPPAIGAKTVAGNIKIDPLSGGNNLAILNYS